MRSRRKTKHVSWLILSAAVLGGSGAVARAESAKPAVDPNAIAALNRMGAFLRSQKAMTIIAEMTTDDVLDSGQKVQVNGVATLKVRRPDRMRIDVASDRRNEQIFFDGKTFTIYQPALSYYASFDAPRTLSQLVETAEEKYGIDLPLADLFYWGGENSSTAGIKGAISLGPSTVKGAKCDHYAYHQADVDWEIFLEQGARPLPRKLVVTTTSERTQPQHVVQLTWDLSPRLDEAQFAFAPPSSAHRIQFDVASASAPPTPRGRAGDGVDQKGTQMGGTQ
jgi:hypothetical protein